MSEAGFEAWPKIPRHGKGGVVITEKIDGTNAQINIVPSDSVDIHPSLESKVIHTFYDGNQMFKVFAGSRKRYITPDDDNYGFARWVAENAEDLSSLGEGRHFGEWYGAGIQIGYGLDHKRLALFNTSRWGEHNPNTPECCGVVPILYAGELGPNTVDTVMFELAELGSAAVPEWMEPEGIIVYNTSTRQLQKLTFKHQQGKWRD